MFWLFLHPTAFDTRKAEFSLVSRIQGTLDYKFESLSRELNSQPGGRHISLVNFFLQFSPAL